MTLGLGHIITHKAHKGCKIHWVMVPNKWGNDFTDGYVLFYKSTGPLYQRRENNWSGKPDCLDIRR